MVESTSSGVLSNSTSTGLIVIGGDLARLDSTNAGANMDWQPLEQTNSGVTLSEEPVSLSRQLSTTSAIAELRRISGLTWEQLAKVFGVARRSLHFWASGKKLTSQNEQKLFSVLSTVQAIDRGNARINRMMLVSPMPDGRTPLELFAAKEYASVIEVLKSTAKPRRMFPSEKLSQDAQEARRPSRPADLVGALHETVHKEIGRSRSRRAARAKKK